jgi:hypothetical protein
MRGEVVAANRGAVARQPQERLRRAVAWCGLVGSLALAAFAVWGPPRKAAPAERPATAQPRRVGKAPAAERAAPAIRDGTRGVGLRRIETIRVGQRVLGRNPQGPSAAGVEPEPEAATWRQIDLELRKGNGRLLYVVLLRPLGWLESRQARVGGVLWLDLPRMGACGWSEVKGISPCPEIERGAGSVVTGTFRHEPDDNVLDVRLSGQSEPIGVTATHPWWSEDRQQFVAIEKMRAGERVRTGVEGVLAIASIEHRPRTAWVYNLEVHGEHVYQVSALGVLVHNDNTLGVPTPTRDPIKFQSPHVEDMKAAAKDPIVHDAYTDPAAARAALAARRGESTAAAASGGAKTVAPGTLPYPEGTYLPPQVNPNSTTPARLYHVDTGSVDLARQPTLTPSPAYSARRPGTLSSDGYGGTFATTQDVLNGALTSPAHGSPITDLERFIQQEIPGLSSEGGPTQLSLSRLNVPESEVRFDPHKFGADQASNPARWIPPTTTGRVEQTVTLRRFYDNKLGIYRWYVEGPVGR